MLLAGDLGATKTSLAIYAAKSGPRKPLHEATLRSAQYPDLQSLVQHYLQQSGVTVDNAAFGVAGPVVGGRATITNLGWEMDEQALARALGLSRVQLLNDLQVIGCAVPALQQEDLSTLSAGQAVPGGAIAVIAPGTGLGEAFLTWDGSQYRSHPTEGGHTDFAPTTELQAGLLEYLSERYEHVSYERVCSGMGLPNIYAYLSDSGFAPEPDWLAEQLAAAHDPTPVIVNAALSEERTCALCQATLDTFVSILGAEAGNLALKVLATGGVYLGGGIPPRILPALQTGPFLHAFRAKGRFSEFMSRLPVHVILTPQVALLGAAIAGLRL
jgi:glucokinase